MIVRFHVTGEDKVAAELLRFGARAQDARPAFRAVAEEMRDKMGDRFDSEGGGDWPALAPSTVAAKAQKGLDPRILHATRNLRDSLTQDGHPDSVEILGRDFLVFGSQDEKGPFHQSGTVHMPQRQVIAFATDDRIDFAKTIQRWIVEGIPVAV